MTSKIKTTIAAAAVLGMFTLHEAVAALNLEDRTRYNPGAAEFRDQELRYDLFGIYGTRNRNSFGSETLGLGVGVNYFFTRHFGVSGDTYLDDVNWPRHLDTSFVARFPLEQVSLAPYALAGFGRQFDDRAQWTGHIGGGAEYRINRNTGLFLDMRRVFPDKDRDFNLWRLGVRLGF